MDENAEKDRKDPHEKDAKTPREALLLFVQAQNQRVGKRLLKNSERGGAQWLR